LTGEKVNTVEYWLQFNYAPYRVVRVGNSSEFEKAFDCPECARREFAAMCDQYPDNRIELRTYAAAGIGIRSWYDVLEARIPTDNAK